jgi:hypothetical protein
MARPFAAEFPTSSELASPGPRRGGEGVDLIDRNLRGCHCALEQARQLRDMIAGRDFRHYAAEFFMSPRICEATSLASSSGPHWRFRRRKIATAVSSQEVSDRRIVTKQSSS